MSFVRKKWIGGHNYHYLVENRREGGKHQQVVLAYLGSSTTAAEARRELRRHDARVARASADPEGGGRYEQSHRYILARAPARRAQLEARLEALLRHEAGDRPGPDASAPCGA
jgi:hypothetical protein